MKRKIIKLAEKTLVVSLPSSYIKDFHLEKGAELDVSFQDSSIIFSPELLVQPKKTYELDAKGLSERSLRWIISSLHKQGYDQIIVLHYTDEQHALLEELSTSLFIGFIIKEKTSLRIVLGEVASISPDEFDRTFRRSFHHAKDQFSLFLEAVEQKDVSLFSQLIAGEKENNKLTNFCERLLNKDLFRKEKGHFWYVLIWNLEKLVDSLKYIALQEQFPEDEQTTLLVEQVVSFVHTYLDLIFSFSLEKLSELSLEKKTLEKEILSSFHIDSVYKHFLHMILLQCADFSASTLAIQEVVGNSI